MAKSRTDLIRAALERLNAIPRGGVPSYEDSAKADSFIDPMIADLHSRNIAWDLSGDTIEDAQFLHLVAILANALKDDFGLDGADSARIEAASEMAERKLKVTVRSLPRKPVVLGFSYELGPYPNSVTGVDNAS